jgi:hypothetical protein
MALAGVLACAGCAGGSTWRPASPEEDPSGEQRLRDTLQVAAREPSTWSPAVAIALYPVLFVADTSIKFSVATANYIRAIFGGLPSALPIPEPVERSIERSAGDGRTDR